jgi:hypothetical protein
MTSWENATVEKLSSFLSEDGVNRIPEEFRVVSTPSN